MPQLTPQVSEVLEKALALPVKDRSLIIDRLMESLDREPTEEGVEAAWSDENLAPDRRNSIRQSGNDSGRASFERTRPRIPR